MGKESAAGPANDTGVDPAPPKRNGAENHQAVHPGFILYEDLKPLVPLCDRSLREAIRKGLIPSVLLPGGRRRLFHWDSVQAALLRMQRGQE